MLTSQEVLEGLKAKGISLRAGSHGNIAEEAPEAYKDVDEVVQTCEECGIGKRVAKLVPICVIKG